MLFGRTLTWKELFFTCILATCGLRGYDAFEKLCAQATAPRRYSVDSTTPGITGRDAITMPAGTCIVFQIPPSTHYSVCHDMYNLGAWLPQQFGIVQDVKSEVYREPKGSYWWSALHNVEQCIPTFNCAAYALGEAAGLTVADYLACEPSDATLGVHPVQIILDSYFDLQASWTSEQFAANDLTSDGRVRSGDIICFVDRPEKYIHLAVVSMNDGEKHLVGKLGAGPVLRTTVPTLISVYQDKYDQVRCYRRKPR